MIYLTPWVQLWQQSLNVLQDWASMKKSCYICSVCQAHGDILKCVKLNVKAVNGKSIMSYKFFSQIEVFHFPFLWSLGKESASLREGSSETNVVIKKIILCVWIKSSQIGHTLHFYFCIRKIDQALHKDLKTDSFFFLLFSAKMLSLMSFYRFYSS